ncbi:MAG: SDR family NAD(P)-dependent oxidoreductase [Candidatus Binatia bacterium]
MTNDARRGFPLKLAFAGAAAAALVYAVRRQRRLDFKGKTVLITGGSRGLGLELARAFVDEGAKVILMARNQIQLAEVARDFERSRSPVAVLACDVSQEEEVRRNVASIVGEFGGIDILVNNAGIIQVGPSEHMKLEDFAAAMDVHFWGPLYLMRAVIPHMKRRGRGRIVNIASIGGKVAVPHLLPYVASKFALVGLSEGMRAELAKDGIYVTTVCPGLMRTGSHLNAFFKGQHEKEFALFSVANASPLLSTSSGRAARQILEACRYGASEVVITPQARLLTLVNSLFPAFVAEALSLVCRALPGPQEAGGDQLKRGWQSRSAVAPSLLTQPADQAALRNREEFQPSAAK